MADTPGMADIRGLNIEKTITGMALVEYVFKDLCTIVPSSTWQNRYWTQTNADLTGGTGSAIGGIPRLANFPHVEKGTTQVNSYMKKFGAEQVISFEDVHFDAIDVIKDSLLRVARSITKAVDAEIWDVITENRSVSTINSVTIEAGNEFNSATMANRDPLQNIIDARTEIMKDNYSVNASVSLLLSPTDFANIIGNASIRNVGQFYTDSVTENGIVGRIAGCTVRVSNNVTADYAAVVVDKTCATWREGKPLTTVTIDNQGISYTVRSWEIGNCELKNPEAVCLIINTQA